MLPITGNPVFVDVEGIPERGFYYLIGLRVKGATSTDHYSFWADDSSEEEAIWFSFLDTLSKLNNPQLIHYGSFETTFFRKMKERYPAITKGAPFIDKVVSESINLLSIIYAQIYFPTYSNGLKDIAGYLGFRWSDPSASGLKSIMQRSQWESSKETNLKQSLITYNAEDCEAAEIVAGAIARLWRNSDDSTSREEAYFVQIEKLQREDPYRFKYGKIDFEIPEFDEINRAAYWDYQQEKIFVRSNPRTKRSSKNSSKSSHKLPVNKVVECQIDDSCPKCGGSSIYKYGKLTRISDDLKFTPRSMKRRVIKYNLHRYICRICHATFPSQHAPKTEKFGPNLLAYAIYQMIDLPIQQRALARNLNQFFGFQIGHGEINRQKIRAASLYKSCYEHILKKITTGRLIHADETRMGIIGKEIYVWVLTSLDDVAYFFTETREGDSIQELLRNFKGVLVSDFYSVYDSIDCPQQKCLVHLMRDLNDDLCKHPYNEELKKLIRDFADLLKPMIQTIDRFGLKTHYLQKHKNPVDQFYKRISNIEFKTEVVVAYKKRFQKNREKLFTFLDHDGVPWNNNNAEHAIKSFAKLRNAIGGSSTERGIQDYLILLSICETCKYKGINFFDFLLSQEKDIELYLKKSKRVTRQYPH